MFQYLFGRNPACWISLHAVVYRSAHVLEPMFDLIFPLAQSRDTQLIGSLRLKAISYCFTVIPTTVVILAKPKSQSSPLKSWYTFAKFVLRLRPISSTMRWGRADLGVGRRTTWP